MTRTINEGELGRADVRALLAHHVAEMNAGSPPSTCHVLAAEELDDPAIRFFTIRDERAALLGVGALKKLDPTHGELKSMRTAPAALGTGAGSAMLAHLVVIARASEMSRISLETGNAPLFAAANRLYQREGFVSCGAFAGYAPSDFTLFYTREI